MQNFNFSTVGIAIYSLGGNDWYAIEQDDKKVLLVDTDCKIGDKELRTPWSEANENSPEVENGQCILNYCNSIADTYFGNIKYAIVPRTVEAGTCRTENALMWPMSYDEFKSTCSVSDIGDKIAENSGSDVWTRSLVNVFFNGRRYVWKINRVNEYFEGDHAGKSCGVAPAFYLKKSAIDRVTRSGRIILKAEGKLKEFETLKDLQSNEELQKMGRYEWQRVKLNREEVFACTTNQQYEDILWGKTYEMLGDLYEHFEIDKIPDEDLCSEVRDLILERLEKDGIKFVDVFDEY